MYMFYFLVPKLPKGTGHWGLFMIHIGFIGWRILWPRWQRLRVQKRIEEQRKKEEEVKKEEQQKCK